MEATKSRFGPLQIGILVLALATAFIHLYLALTSPGTFKILFTLNGLGYLTLTVLYFLPALARYHGVIRWLFIAFAAITILGYFALNGVHISTLGIITKLIEVILIVLLFLDKQS
jgi:hypothetical protein